MRKVGQDSTKRLSDLPKRAGYDFSESKRTAIVKSTKERITMRLDPDILDWLRDRVQGGGNYQTLSNEAL